MDADTWTQLDPKLAATMSQHAGPALRALGDYPYDVDRIFRRGLAVLLDGLEQHRERQRRPVNDL